VVPALWAHQASPLAVRLNKYFVRKVAQ
jgi:hypothetical protein